jgi:hypothetical protein
MLTKGLSVDPAVFLLGWLSGYFQPSLYKQTFQGPSARPERACPKADSGSQRLEPIGYTFLPAARSQSARL